MVLMRSPSTVITRRPKIRASPDTGVPQVSAECGLAVGPSGNQPVAPAVSERDSGEEMPDQLATLVLDQNLEPSYDPA